MLVNRLIFYGDYLLETVAAPIIGVSALVNNLIPASSFADCPAYRLRLLANTHLRNMYGLSQSLRYFIGRPVNISEDRMKAKTPVAGGRYYSLCESSSNQIISGLRII